MIEVYCLPGTMCNELLWQDVISYLPSEICVRHVEIPVVDNVLDMVLGILSGLPKEPVHMLGFSLGGYLLSEMASVAPEQIKSAMLLSNTARELPDREKAQRLQALEWVSKSGYRGIPVKKAKAMLLPEHASQEHMVQKIIDMDKAVGERAFLSQLQATIERRNNLEAIANSHAPWKVLAGLGDQFVSAEALKELAKLDNVTVNMVAQSGHMLPLEQPKWVADKMTQFFLN